MTYEEAAKKYLECRKEIDDLDKKYKEDKANIMKRVVLLEGWFTAKAQEEGLKTVPTPYGTGYWSTHHTATVESREDFFKFCKENGTWDLVATHASKSGVKSFIEAHGEPPPGVKFASTKVFNFRKAQNKE
jgi:hypothetical protein